jgi:hypothetical protein
VGFVWGFGRMIPSVASTSVLGGGPTLRVAGPAVATDSSSIPAYLSLAIPAQAQVGDYLVIATSNGTSMDSSYLRADKWRPIYAGLTTGSTYNENCVLWVTICRQEDLGTTVRLNAGSFHFQAIMNVFTNPNNTYIEELFGFQIFQYYPELLTPNSNITKTTSNSSSLSIPAIPGKSYPPNYLRITACACNGSSTYPSQSFSGAASSTLRVRQDSYWWRSVATVYETANTNSSSVGTFSFNSSSSAAVTLALI